MLAFYYKAFRYFWVLRFRAKMLEQKLFETLLWEGVNWGFRGGEIHSQRLLGPLQRKSCQESCSRYGWRRLLLEQLWSKDLSDTMRQPNTTYLTCLSPTSRGSVAAPKSRKQKPQNHKKASWRKPCSPQDNFWIKKQFYNHLSFLT